MAPVKLQRHLHTKHVNRKDKHVVFSECKCDSLMHSQSLKLKTEICVRHDTK
jgi:hypothetical protein